MQILYQLSHKGNPRILKWVAYPSSSGSTQPRNQTGDSCIVDGLFTNWAIREAPGIGLVVDLICGSVCLSLARHLQSQLAGMVILWVSVIPRPTVSLPYLAFGFWLVVTPSLHCKVYCYLIMAGPWAFHSSTPSFQPPLEELQKLLGIIHTGSTGWFHYR